LPVLLKGDLDAAKAQMAAAALRLYCATAKNDALPTMVIWSSSIGLIGGSYCTGMRQVPAASRNAISPGERAFSAGGDIHEQREDDRRYTQEELDAHRPPRRGSYEIAACTKPTIGMINGLAYGGAAVLASSLDMRVGCEDSRFRFLAAAYGRINSTWTLPNQVGWPIAKELLR
jgi:hypothetical protein